MSQNSTKISNAFGFDSCYYKSMKMYPNLDQIEGFEALAFATKESKKTLDTISANPWFNVLKKEIEPILSSPDQLQWGYRRGNFVYNIWTDSKNEKGLWRRCSIDSFLNNENKWETVLDLDQLCKDENKNWVWAGSTFLRPNYDRCLIELSDGGKDANTVREFDLIKKEFINDGFFVPESKSIFEWVDKNTLLLGMNWSEEDLTTSGYPRVIKILKRGQELSQAKEVFQVPRDHIGAGITVNIVDGSPKDIFFVDNKSFYEQDLYTESKIKIPMPSSASLCEIFEDQLIYLLKEDLITPKATIPCGSVVSFSKENLDEDHILNNIKIVFQPTEKCIFSALGVTKNSLIINVMDNVQGKLISASYKDNLWTLEDLYESAGSVSLYDTDENSEDIFISETGFLLPTTISCLNVENKAIKTIQKEKSVFNDQQMTSSQRWATSKDGTLVPYFIVHKKDLELNSSNPTLMYGYGGFEESMEPGYLSISGKVWLERGGVYVLANIRGGGEFGPRWHQAGLKENRHKVFEDFIAIAEDLISSKVTSPSNLGIEGGSNGGLLVSAVTTMRPELFNAVICKVPLTDMLSYHTLLAGASWMDEYGNPDIEADRQVLESYSPLHQLKENVKYPEMYIFTSTKDDRVHPSHARKFVARLRDLNQEVFYFENINGGHGGSADLSEESQNLALEYTYLFMKLAS